MLTRGGSGAFVRYGVEPFAREIEFPPATRRFPATVKDCMVCHQAIATDKPEIMKVAAYEMRGEEIPWQRVYGWTDEAHVRFNHAPHIRAEVQCSTCHGDIPQMTVARRVVDHTMGFCVSCHQERKVSNDCVTCHY